MSLIIDYIRNFWNIFSAMAPWLLFGYLAAGIIAFFLKPEQVKKHFGGGRIASVLKAVLVGIPLPVCSCGVIPIANALRNEGAGKGSTSAFFISTPQIGVDSAIVTASMLGWCAAMLRAVIAFLSGFTGGVLISKFCDDQAVAKPEIIKPEVKEEKKKTCCCCCHNKQTQKSNGEKKPWKNIFTYGFLDMLKSTAPSLLLGMVIAALIQQVVPENFGAEYLCGNILLEFAVVLIFSIPLYICSSASVPVAAVLILKGFSPGAALLFLIAGPTIHSVSITSMRQIIGAKATVIAVSAIAFWAVCAGTAVNIFNIPINAATAASANAAVSGITKNVCGVILAVLICRALAVRYLKKYFTA